MSELLDAIKSIVHEARDKHTHKGHCQACGALQAHETTGGIAKHGYKVDMGYFNGTCPGSGHKPLEHSHEFTDRVIQDMHTRAATNRRRVADAKAGKTDPPVFSHQEKVLDDKGYHRYNHRGMHMYRDVHKPYSESDAVKRDNWHRGMENRAQQAEDHAHNLEGLKKTVHGKPLIPSEHTPEGKKLAAAKKAPPPAGTFKNETEKKRHMENLAYDFDKHHNILQQHFLNLPHEQRTEAKTKVYYGPAFHHWSEKHSAEARKEFPAAKDTIDHLDRLAAERKVIKDAPVQKKVKESTDMNLKNRILEQTLEEGLKSKMSPYDAHEFLKQHDMHGTDYFALHHDKVQTLVDKAKEVGYRKGKNAPGSTARMFHHALHLHAARWDRSPTNPKNRTESVNEERIPLHGHPYHSKTNDELHHIIRDAGEASRLHDEMHGSGVYNKYADQVNDAATILHHRKTRWSNDPHKTFPNAHFVHGRKANGDRVFYTGRAGEGFISSNGNEAFRYDNHEGAHRRATEMNKHTPNHGVHFTVLSPKKVEESVMNEAEYGLKGAHRDYKCDVCQYVHSVSTNHTGPIHSYCPNCSWRSGYDSKGNHYRADTQKERPHEYVKDTQYDGKTGFRIKGVNEGADEHENFKDHTQNPLHKTLTAHGFVHQSTTHKQNPLTPNNPKADFTEHVYTHPNHGRSRVIVTQYHDKTVGVGGVKSWMKATSYRHRHEQENGIMAPSIGNNKNELHRDLSREYGVPKGMEAPKLVAWEKKNPFFKPYKMNEVSWHQRKAGPIALDPKQHHVIDDGAYGTGHRGIMSFSSRERAEEYRSNLLKHHPNNVAHIKYATENTVLSVIKRVLKEASADSHKKFHHVKK